MFEQNIKHSSLRLNETEATQLARLVQILVRELGFDPEEVDRSYNDSRAYFLKNDRSESGSWNTSFQGAKISTTHIVP